MTERIEREMVGVAVVAGRALPVRIFAAALGVDEPTILEVGSRLVAQGRLVEDAGGYAPGPGAEPPGEAARASLAGRLADVLEGADVPPTFVARLLVASGRVAAGARKAVEAAADAAKAGRGDEAAELAGIALAAGERVLGTEEKGRMHLILARNHRARGETAEAAAAVAEAVRRLGGVEKVDALGFAAAIADDRQLPQQAEVLVAMGEMVAWAAGEPAKAGSLLTFHGRELSRLGFAREADRVIERGSALLAEHGSRLQRYLGRTNRAWVALDRGEAAAAELEFTRLWEDADELEGPVGRAVQAAYLSRASFATGRIREALERRDEALAAAIRHEADAPAFLAHMATAEGALWLHRYADALAGADAALRLVEAALPAWENAIRYLRARALTGLGRREEAREETAAALAACPPGIDGERWRLRIRALDLDLTRGDGRWPRKEAEDLVDLMLQSGWSGAALELMLMALAAGDGGAEEAAETAALALRLGIPMAAAEAFGAADAWDLPEAAAVARAVRRVAPHLPDGWRDDWQRLPFVAAAFALEEQEAEGEEAAARALGERLDRVLAEVGLAADGTVLSPAQRRARGLVRHRPVVRRMGRMAATGLAVAAVAVVAAVVAVPRLLPPPPPAPTLPSTTTTTTIPLTRDRLLVPAGSLSGGAAYRGGPERTGVLEAHGPRGVAGRYWKVSPGGFFGADPVAYGKLLFVPSSTSDLVYALDQTTGEVSFEVALGSRPSAAVTVGQVKSRDALTSSGLNLLVAVTEDGGVYARDAIQAAVASTWQVTVPGVVRGAPVIVDNVVVVATDRGVVVGLDAKDLGNELWRYPADGTMGEVVAAPAAADGLVYVADRDGRVHLLDGVTGEPLCPSPLSTLGPVVVPPVVADGTLYVFMEQGQIQAWPAGRCGGVPEGRSGVYPSSSVPILLPPAVDGDTLFLLERQRLLALRLDPATFDPSDPSSQFLWLPYSAESVITTPPVVADGVVYVGTQEGWVRAVDAATGEELWAVDLGSKVEQAPVVVDGAVFVVTADGTVWALGS